MVYHEPKTGVSTEVCHVLLIFTVDIYVSIFMWYKRLNIGRHEPLTFRHSFWGHGIPRIRPKIGPQDERRNHLKGQ